MTRARTGAVLIVAIVVIAGGLAHSEGGSGSAGSGSAEPHDDDDDDGGEAGSGGAVIAPPDPTVRLAWLRERLSAARASRPTLAKAKIAYHVVDLASGKELASLEPELGLNLASNTKVVTSVAALAGLGGGFRWRTTVSCVPPDDAGVVAGDLYLKSRGDPVLSVDGLRSLALEVAARGVRTVEGKLVIDTGYFDDVTEPPHFGEQPREVAAFRAPIASFAVARSAYTVVVMAEPGGGDARVTVEPRLVGDYLKLVRSDVRSIATGRTRLRLEAKPKRDGVELDLTGQIRGRQGTWDLKRRVDDPARFAGEIWRRALAEQGIKVRTRAIAYGSVPTNLKAIAIHDSPTLADVLRSMNKHSDNNVAETLLKTLGAEQKGTPGPATWADGQRALRAQLGRLGVTGAYRVDNGSGLFASTEFSAHQLVTLLAAAHADYRIGPDLVASLPVGGVDGTLARRWRGRPAQGRVRAKTGTLDKVVTLAGYVGVDGNHLLAFAILANAIPPGQRGAVRAMADDMVDSLAAYLDAR